MVRHALLLAACAAAIADDGASVRLAFAPDPAKPLVVRYALDETWDYASEDMKGTLHTELTLRWTFTRKDGKTQGVATYDRVVHRAKGRKKGADFDHDVEWTAKDGYAKGEGSEADTTWCASEIKEGVRLGLDDRGTCEQGEC